jgi:hypothetical protein
METELGVSTVGVFPALARRFFGRNDGCGAQHWDVSPVRWRGSVTSQRKSSPRHNRGRWNPSGSPYLSKNLVGEFPGEVFLNPLR